MSMPKDLISLVPDEIRLNASFRGLLISYFFAFFDHFCHLIEFSFLASVAYGLYSLGLKDD